MLAIDGISSGELFTFALAFISMLVAVVTQATLERSARKRNTTRLDKMDSEEWPSIDRRVRKLETWRSERRGAEMVRQGKDPDLMDTSTRQTRRPGED